MNILTIVFPEQPRFHRAMKGRMTASAAEHAAPLRALSPSRAGKSNIHRGERAPADVPGGIPVRP